MNPYGVTALDMISLSIWVLGLIGMAIAALKARSSTSAWCYVILWGSSLMIWVMTYIVAQRAEASWFSLWELVEAYWRSAVPAHKLHAIVLVLALVSPVATLAQTLQIKRARRRPATEPDEPSH